jgi:hypothetical protein
MDILFIANFLKNISTSAIIFLNITLQGKRTLVEHIHIYTTCTYIYIYTLTTQGPLLIKQAFIVLEFALGILIFIQ